MSFPKGNDFFLFQLAWSTPGTCFLRISACISLNGWILRRSLTLILLFGLKLIFCVKCSKFSVHSFVTIQSINLCGNAFVSLITSNPINSTTILAAGSPLKSCATTSKLSKFDKCSILTIDHAEYRLQKVVASFFRTKINKSHI